MAEPRPEGAAEGVPEEEKSLGMVNRIQAVDREIGETYQELKIGRFGFAPEVEAFIRVAKRNPNSPAAKTFLSKLTELRNLAWAVKKGNRGYDKKLLEDWTRNTFREVLYCLMIDALKE